MDEIMNAPQKVAGTCAVTVGPEKDVVVSHTFEGSYTNERIDMCLPEGCFELDASGLGPTKCCLPSVPCVFLSRGPLLSFFCLQIAGVHFLKEEWREFPKRRQL